MKTSLRIVFILCVTAALAPAARAAGPDWATVIDWREPLDAELEKKNGEAIKKLVAARVSVSPQGWVKGTTPNNGDAASDLESHALGALALMSALPHLAKGGSAEDEKLFTAARACARDAMNRVLKKTLPELLDPKKPVAAAQTIRGQQSADLPALYSSRIYSIGVLLMSLELYFAGALELDFDAAARREDRPARGFFTPPKAAQVGIARLVALLLSREPGDAALDGNLGPGALYGYTQLGISPEQTCLHKSSFAFMGIRAALSLGLTSFDKEAFDFKWAEGDKEVVGKDRFMNRLNDVLIHTILTLMRVRGDGTARQSIGVLGFAKYVEVETVRRAAIPDLEGGSVPVNLRRYRTVYGSNDNGRRIFSVEYDRAGEDWPAGVPREVAFRYILDASQDGAAYGTYHTSCGAYCLVTAANALPLVLDPAREEYGRQYRLKRRDAAGKSWALGDGPGVRVFRTDADAGPYTQLTVSGGESLDINLRVTQCLQFMVRLASRPAAGGGPAEQRPRELDRRKVTLEGVERERWGATLTLRAPGYDTTLRGVNLFGFVKLGIAVGCPDAFGPWNYYRDVCERVADPECIPPKGVNAHAHCEFALLCLTRGYRPLFGRDSAPR